MNKYKQEAININYSKGNSQNSFSDVWFVCYLSTLCESQL